jgi:hypothetical protein
MEHGTFSGIDEPIIAAAFQGSRPRTSLVTRRMTFQRKDGDLSQRRDHSS